VACAAVLAVITSIDASAQSIAIGGKVGAPLNDSFDANSGFSGNPFTFFTKRYTVGPTFELMFPMHIGFEADALYKRSGYTQDFTIFSAQTKLNSWEFPLLFKAASSGETVGVFGDGGVTFRHIEGSTTYSTSFTPSLSRPVELTDPWAHGFVAGGGVSLRFGSVHFEPELRYTRWASGNFSVPAFISNPNQIEYLLGIKFKK
jgi:hypothetical protein